MMFLNKKLMSVAIAIQVRETKLFNIYVVIIGFNKFRKYAIKTATSRILVWNRRFNRKRAPQSLDTQC